MSGCVAVETSGTLEFKTLSHFSCEFSDDLTIVTCVLVRAMNRTDVSPLSLMGHEQVSF